MTSKSKLPSADADLAELHAWAARANKAEARGKTETRGSGGTGPAMPSAAATSTTSFNVPATNDSRAAGRPGGRGGSLLPKVLLAAGVGLAAYLVFSFVIGLLMTLLAIVGGVALLYGAYRIGRRRGNRDQ